MKAKHVAACMAALFGISTVAIAPADAQNLNSILRNLGLRGGGSSVNEAQVQSNIQVGMNNISNQIQAGIRDGRLTVDEQAMLNAEMNRISNMHSSFSLNGYTNAEVQEILSAFTNLNNMLSTALNNANTTIGFGGYNQYNYNNPSNYLGYPTSYNNVLSLRNKISNDINLAVSRGHLSASQAASLRAELRDINQSINNRTVRGNLNINPLVRRLVSLEQRVNNAIAGGSFWF
jgi:hypothetical protein